MAPELGRRVDHAGEQLILAEIIGPLPSPRWWWKAQPLPVDVLPGTARAKRWSGGAGRPAGVYR